MEEKTILDDILSEISQVMGSIRDLGYKFNLEEGCEKSSLVQIIIFKKNFGIPTLSNCNYIMGHFYQVFIIR